MCGRAPSPPPPDPAIGQAARENVALGREQLAFAKEQWGFEQRQIEELRPLIDRILSGQASMNELQMALAESARKDFEKYVQPVEEKYFREAERAGSWWEQEAAAARAGIDAQRAADIAREANAQALAQMGINPNSGRFAGMSRATEVMNAAARAGAMTAARENERVRGIALRQDAAQIGRGLPGTALAASQAGVASGGAMLGTAQTPLALNAAAAGRMMAGYGGAIGANQSAAGILNAQYANQLAGWQASQQSQDSLFAALGTGIGYMMGGPFGGAFGGWLFSGKKGG
jgi:hypothetical protein